MKHYEEKVKIMYKIISNGYDLMDFFVFPNGKANPRKGLADQLQNEPLKILDVCCGTGNSSIAIGRKNSNNVIIGIDLSEDMLKIARKKTLKNQLDNLSFKEMNATKMDFENDYYDVVTISLALHEMPQDLINTILVEINRVLKVGGKLYIIDWEKPEHFIASKLFSIFPTLSEPKEFKQFLKIDWEQLLNEFCFAYETIEHYTFTKLIVAKKEVSIT